MKYGLTREELEKLTTPRLLAYLDSIRKVPENPNWDGEGGMNKNHPRWQELYRTVKSVLATREHVE